MVLGKTAPALSRLIKLCGYQYFKEDLSLLLLSKRYLMIRLLLLSSLRVNLKNKLYFFINLFGLTIGMIAVIAIIQYIVFESSFDNYHRSPENLFRVSMEMHSEGNATGVSTSYSAIGPALQSTYPEVEDFVFTSQDVGNYGFVGAAVMSEVKTMYTNGAYFASSNFLNIFNSPIVSSINEQPLSDINDMVITEKLAKRLFGDENPLGKRIYWFTNESGRVQFQVSAIIEDPPPNSHLQFEVLMSMERFFDMHPTLHDLKWRAYGFHTYIRLKPGVDHKEVESRLEGFITSNLGKSYDEAVHTELFLMPIRDIHLYSKLLYETTVNGDASTLKLLGIIVGLLIIMAYANYLNLTTFIAVTRAKEVGVKKVLGSSIHQLVTQFQVETLVTNLLAFSIAVGVLHLFDNQLSNQFDGYPEFVLLQSRQFWIYGLTTVIALSLLTGFYPALLISSQKSVVMLKGAFSNSSKGMNLRRNMVIFQFVIATGLIVFGMVVNRQLQFMLNQDTGTAIDQVLVLKRPHNALDFQSKYSSFRNELLNSSVIGDLTISSSIPGTLTWGTGGVRRISESPEMGRLMTRIHVDEDYLEVYDLEVIAGRSFSRDFQGDEGSVLLTRNAAELLNPEDPESVVGQQLIFYRDTSQVIGLIENYYHHSLKLEYQPIGLKLTPDGSFISVKVASSDLADVLKTVELAWQNHFQNNPFDFFFLDDHFNQSYQQERNLGKIVSVFSTLAVIIACLGLFALSSFMLHSKVKEIGIRKVLGAKVVDLFWTLSADIFKWIIIASLIAIPISVYGSFHWLESFPNRMLWEWLIPFIPLFLMLFSAAISISYNVIRSVYINPVKSLRSE